jgi:hypothetical protein
VGQRDKALVLAEKVVAHTRRVLYILSRNRLCKSLYRARLSQEDAGEVWTIQHLLGLSLSILEAEAFRGVLRESRKTLMQFPEDATDGLMIDCIPPPVTSLLTIPATLEKTQLLP